MSVTRSQVAAEAMAWVGTPFHWQAATKGVGADCLGLVVGVATALGLPEARTTFVDVRDYGDRVPVGLLKRGLRETMDPVRNPADGDILLLKLAGRAQHLAIVAGDRLVHATSRGRRTGVVDVSLAASLRVWAVDSAWRFRSVEAG